MLLFDTDAPKPHFLNCKDLENTKNLDGSEITVHWIRRESVVAISEVSEIPPVKCVIHLYGVPTPIPIRRMDAVAVAAELGLS